MARLQASSSLKAEASKRMIQVAYILGISLLIAGVIYFFTANWPVFDRATKLALSLGLMLGFYLLSFILGRILPDHGYLSRLLLLAGAIAFGISIILIGQIYNSHTSVYILFLVWGTIATLLALLSKEESIYTLAFVLFNLALWFYFYAAGALWSYSPERMLVTMYAFLVLNSFFFYLSQSRKLELWLVQLLSFMTVHGFLLYFSLQNVNEKYFLVTNASYLLVLGLTIYYLSRIYNHPRQGQQTLLLRLSYASAAIYLLLKYFEYIAENFQTSSFVITIGIALLALLANVFYAKYKRNKLDKNPRIIEAESLEVETTATSSSFDESDVASTEKNQLWSYISTVLLTVVIATVITASLIFLITETMGDFYDLRMMFFFLSILGFILPGLIIDRYNQIISYTLIAIGYLMLSITIFSLENYYLIVWLPLMALAIYFLNNQSLRSLLYIPLHLVLIIKVYEELTRFDLTILLLIAMNVLVLLANKYYHNYREGLVKEGLDEGIKEEGGEEQKRKYLDKNALQTSLYENSFFYIILLLFILSFYDGSIFGLKSRLFLSIPIHYIYNILFFSIASYLIFWSQKHNRSYEYRVAMSFWFMYLIYKYYDLVWSLLHKSIALIILGIIFLLLAFVYEHKIIKFWAKSADDKAASLIIRQDEKEEKASNKEIWRTSLGLALALVGLQVGILGIQIASAEMSLARGQDIILQLDSTGLYSIEQGSHYQLGYNYEISRLGEGQEIDKELTDIEWEEYWANRWDKDLVTGQRMELVLKADEGGIHRYSRLYTGGYLGADEVLIVGQYAGWRINFGIESFTYTKAREGLEYKAQYAKVRVSDKGDAIVLDILEK